MLLYQILITALLGFMLLVLLFNLVAFRSLGYYGFKWKLDPEEGAELPYVSVLVPARNEAGNISRCVRSLLAQNYPNFEIIVLDDNSQDGTAGIVEMLSNPTDDPSHRLRLVEGQPLPEGWLGKNFACHQLSQYAQGELLLFTDADTNHSVGALAKAVTALKYERADFLSLFPRQQTVTLAERLVVPLVMLFVAGLLPVWYVSRSRNPAFSAANGQFMLFRREAYDQIGGHSAVRGVVLEDVVLGRRIKQAGLKQILPDGSDLVQCRMYRNSYEVWGGFSKNLFAFFGFSRFWFALFMTLNLLAFIFPYFWLLLGWITGQPRTLEWFWLPLAQIGLAWLLRFIVAFRFGFRGLDALLHPVSIIYMFVIGLNSVQWSRKGGEWKGRKYLLGPRP